MNINADCRGGGVPLPASRRDVASKGKRRQERTGDTSVSGHVKGMAHQASPGEQATS